MEIQKATVVKSAAGHDKDEIFIVIDTENEYALIANGKTRPVNKPKRKKLKHLRFVSQNCGQISEKLLRGEDITNKEIRKGLAELSAYPAETHGGM